MKLGSGLATGFGPPPPGLPWILLAGLWAAWKTEPPLAAELTVLAPLTAPGFFPLVLFLLLYISVTEPRLPLKETRNSVSLHRQHRGVGVGGGETLCRGRGDRSTKGY